MRIVVIGTGISGLGAAHALSKGHEVELFECDDRAGGHSNTVEHMVAGRTLRLDTGFIVHNEDTYPNLVRLFRELGVRTQPAHRRRCRRILSISSPTRIRRRRSHKAAGEWLELGAQLVGGCCGTGPEHVRAIRHAVDTHSARCSRLPSVEGAVNRDAG